MGMSRLEMGQLSSTLPSRISNGRNLRNEVGSSHYCPKHGQCRLCENIEEKARKLQKAKSSYLRWSLDPYRQASAARALEDMDDISAEIRRMAADRLAKFDNIANPRRTLGTRLQRAASPRLLRDDTEEDVNGLQVLTPSHIRNNWSLAAKNDTSNLMRESAPNERPNAATLGSILSADIPQAYAIDRLGAPADRLDHGPSERVALLKEESPSGKGFLGDRGKRPVPASEDRAHGQSEKQRA